MNAEKLTQKSAEAIRAANHPSTASPQIEQAHLLWALLQDAEGLIPSCWQGWDHRPLLPGSGTFSLVGSSPGCPPPAIGQPDRTSPPTPGPEPGREDRRRDEGQYTSVEHLFLGLLDTAGRDLGQVFSDSPDHQGEGPPGHLRAGATSR